MSDIDCIADSCAATISLPQIKKYQKWVSECYDRPIQLPKEYVNCLLHCHGGIPRKRCFKISRGRVRVICRFLNLLNADALRAPLKRTWRQWADHDIRLDYSVYSIFGYEAWRSHFDENDLAELLVPFAAIDSAGHDARGMDTFDLLCFDYGVSNTPPVVYWEYEEFHRYHPKKNLVAPSFAQFTEMLYDDPKNAVVRQKIDNF